MLKAVLAVFAFTTAHALPAQTVPAQRCERGYSIDYRMGVFSVVSPDHHSEALVPDTDKTAHSASYQVVWDANPNGLGGAVIFPNGEKAVNCTKLD